MLAMKKKKRDQLLKPILVGLRIPESEVYGEDDGANWSWYQHLLAPQGEGNMVKPVPRDLRTETAINKLFTVFFTCLLYILP